jgi:hypothetical protein
MTGRWAFATGLLLVGCGTESLPPVSIASVVPSGMVASDPTAVSVQVEAQLGFQVDFGTGGLSADSAMQVTVGPLALGDGMYPPGGLVKGVLPTVIAPGSYDVTLTMGDGRTAVRHGAFTVDAGTWPASYSIDAVGAQESGVPFSVTLRAEGARAAGFRGNVLLGLIGDGTLTPEVSGAFDAGVCVDVVTVTGTGEFSLTASDIAGDNGQSAPFTVAP